MRLTLVSSFSPWALLYWSLAHSSGPSLYDARAILGGKSPHLQMRRFRLTENREGERAQKTRRSWPSACLGLCFKVGGGV